MCGITGILYSNGRLADKYILERMTDSLQHRGPDDAGIYLMPNSTVRNGDRAVNVGLGHRRLSIIDITRSGHQPMSNEDKTVWITFNGEIYNYKELRKALIKNGHVFESDTDTEVIIHGYEQYGEGVFEKLNGMFAFGLWDSNSQALYLVRDRFGQKPLFYRPSPNGIIFASELKAFLQHPDISAEIDWQNLSRYLMYEYVPAPNSIYKDINKLPPGHFMRWKDNNFSITPYWRIEFSNGCQCYDEYETELRLMELLGNSIKRRLMSDVPLGVFLSGGIDSSAIVALMSEMMPSERIKTFSIGFEEKSFDESQHAVSIARYFGTDHHQKVLTPQLMIDIIPEIWNFLDEPFADASIVPTYLLSKFTQQYVTVALGGDGGDELLAGYDPFVAHRVAGYVDKLPKYLWQKILNPLSEKFPVSTENMSFDFKLKQFLKGLPYEPIVRHQVWLGSFTKQEQKEILNPEIYHSLNGFDPCSDIFDACKRTRFKDQIEQIIYLYSKFYLADGILTKVDRASMATSLEVRSPFLDVELAEFINRLPSKAKINGLTRKYILKKCLKNKLPKEIIQRKKKGFGIPLAKWFKKELRTYLMDYFSYSRIKYAHIFKPEGIQRLVCDHLDGKRDNRKKIWTLLMFESWRDHYGT